MKVIGYIILGIIGLFIIDYLFIRVLIITYYAGRIILFGCVIWVIIDVFTRLIEDSSPKEKSNTRLPESTRVPIPPPVESIKMESTKLVSMSDPALREKIIALRLTQVNSYSDFQKILLDSRRGGVFYEVTPDGNIVPYDKLLGLNSWEIQEKIEKITREGRLFTKDILDFARDLLDKIK